MNYKPYSQEWHRYRYLKEAIDTYLDDYVDNDIIMNDILDIVCEHLGMDGLRPLWGVENHGD